MSKTVLLIFSDPKVVGYFHPVLNAKILKLCLFFNKDHEYDERLWSPKWKYSGHATAESILLTFQMEQNGTFPENFTFVCWILILDEIFTKFSKNS